MMSLESIREVSARAARKAARERKVPVLVEAEDIEGWRRAQTDGRPVRFPFPHLGTHIPKGFTPTGVEHFVDLSGFGREGEPALTHRQFIEALRPGFAYGISDVGQFQAYVREFTTGASGKGGAARG